MLDKLSAAVTLKLQMSCRLPGVSRICIPKCWESFKADYAIGFGFDSWTPAGLSRPCAYQLALLPRPRSRIQWFYPTIIVTCSMAITLAVQPYESIRLMCPVSGRDAGHPCKATRSI